MSICTEHRVCSSYFEQRAYKKQNTFVIAGGETIISVLVQMFSLKLSPSSLKIGENHQ
jgi:hypothetical protein